ncbi:MAG: thioredoxin-disulfide reductase [Candidatus Puniceispirillales bacterium]
MSANKENILIIGSGSAGLTAAIYASRAGFKPLVLTGIQPGGQLTITTDVENYPGYEDVIQGPWLMEQMQKQAENVGARIEFDLMTNIDTENWPFNITTDSGKEIIAETIIIATGAQARWLGLESEEKYNGKGVSACATCDGFFFKNKNVAVIGGGNTAVEEALYLSNLCKKVTLIHRRNELRAEKILQSRLINKSNVEILWEKKVEEFLGDGLGVNGLKLSSTKDTSSSEIEVDGVFVAIGHDPSTAVFKDKIKLDKDNYVITDKGGTNTSVPGIFAAGDCVDKIYRQAVTAAGMGCMAALDAEKWLAEKK